jgi:Mg2+/citrate symporter
MFTKADIEKYFMAEKQESLVFIIVGGIAVLLALYFLLLHKGVLQKGLAIPLLAIGLLQAVVGFTVYTRSDRQRIDNVYNYDMNPSRLQTVELVRMKKVNSNFVRYRWIEIFCLLAAAVLIWLNIKAGGNRFLLGVGVGLAIQAAILLATDLMAESRAGQYTKGIEDYFKIE